MGLREGTENNFSYYKFHYLETVSYCLLEHLHCFDIKLLFVKGMGCVHTLSVSSRFRNTYLMIKITR